MSLIIGKHFVLLKKTLLGETPTYGGAVSWEGRNTGGAIASYPRRGGRGRGSRGASWRGAGGAGASRRGVAAFRAQDRTRASEK